MTSKEISAKLDEMLTGIGEMIFVTALLSAVVGVPLYVIIHFVIKYW